MKKQIGRLFFIIITSLTHRIFAFENLPYSIVDSTTIRLAHEGQLSNIYISDPLKITYDGHPVASEIHNQLIDAVEKLGVNDEHQVNHLFAQLFCIATSPEGVTQRLHCLICWDSELQKLVLSSNLNDALVVNFVSRDYKSGCENIDNIQFCFISPENVLELAIPHSEHILITYLSNSPALISNGLKQWGLNTNWTIQKFGFIFYSTLDSCDLCQNELMKFFNPSSPYMESVSRDLSTLGISFDINSLGQLIFYSSVPCKKSSYFHYKGGSLNPFQFNKEKNSFFSKNHSDEIIFPCSIEHIDLKDNFAPSLIISNIKSLGVSP